MLGSIKNLYVQPFVEERGKRIYPTIMLVYDVDQDFAIALYLSRLVAFGRRNGDFYLCLHSPLLAGFPMKL